MEQSAFVFCGVCVCVCVCVGCCCLRARPASCASLDPEVIKFSLYCVPFELWSVYPMPPEQTTTAEKTMTTAGGGAGGVWLLLGESDKYVSLSAQRFEGLQQLAAVTAPAPARLTVTVLGSEGETVNIELLNMPQEEEGQQQGQQGGQVALPLPLPVKVVCKVGKSGRATLSCGSSACKCTTDGL